MAKTDWSQFEVIEEPVKTNSKVNWAEFSPIEEPTKSTADRILDTVMAAGKGLYQGVTTDLPEMVGGGLEFLAEPSNPLANFGDTAKAVGENLVTSPIINPARLPMLIPGVGNVIKDTGKQISDWAKERAKEEPLNQADFWTPEGMAYNITKTLGPSLIPGGLITKGARSALGVSKLAQEASAVSNAAAALRAVGRETDAVKAGFLAASKGAQATEAAGTALNIGAGTTAGLFGASQAQTTKETAEQAGIEPGLSPYLTGAIEALGEFFGTKYLGKMLKLDEAKMGLPGMKDFLKTMGVEIGTEVGQQGGEAAVEKYTGIRPGANLLEEMAQAGVTAAGMTILTGGLAHGVGKIGERKKKAQDEARPPIEDITAPPPPPPGGGGISSGIDIPAIMKRFEEAKKAGKLSDFITSLTPEEVAALNQTGQQAVQEQAPTEPVKPWHEGVEVQTPEKKAPAWEEPTRLWWEDTIKKSDEAKKEGIELSPILQAQIDEAKKIRGQYMKSKGSLNRLNLIRENPFTEDIGMAQQEMDRLINQRKREMETKTPEITDKEEANKQHTPESLARQGYTENKKQNGKNSFTKEDNGIIHSVTFNKDGKLILDSNTSSYKTTNSDEEEIIVQIKRNNITGTVDYRSIDSDGIPTQWASGPSKTLTDEQIVRSGWSGEGAQVISTNAPKVASISELTKQATEAPKSDKEETNVSTSGQGQQGEAAIPGEVAQGQEPVKTDAEEAGGGKIETGGDVQTYETVKEEFKAHTQDRTTKQLDAWLEENTVDGKSTDGIGTYGEKAAFKLKDGRTVIVENNYEGAVDNFKAWIKEVPEADVKPYGKAESPRPQTSIPSEKPAADQQTITPETKFSPEAKDEAEEETVEGLNTKDFQKGYGANNKIFTKERADKAREILRKKLTQLNMGLDPEMITAGMDLAGYHIEAGARKFSDYSAKMIADLGEAIKPYLKSFYMAVRNYPDFDNKGMNTEAELNAMEKQGKPLDTKPESDKIETQGEKSNDDSRNGRDSEVALESGVSEDIRSNEEERPSGVRSDSLSEVDTTGNVGIDNRGDVGNVSVGSSEGPVHILRPDQGLQSLDNPAPVSEPRPLNRIGVNPGNYQITDADRIGKGTRGERINNNIAAIRLVKLLDKENRYPTKEEQAILAKYVGWGGLKNVFDTSSDKPQDQKAYSDLQSLLTENELFAARQSVLDAHYTSPEVIQSIYDILNHVGIKGGHFLEPTYGINLFPMLMPEDMASSSKWYGSEMDIITAKIGQYLMPKGQFLNLPFQEAEFPYAKFDAAIGNPPFGDQRITDTNKKRADINGMKIHNYVIGKSAMHVKPGGIMSFVVTSRFLDTANPEMRDYLAKHMKFIGAIRLPNTAFKENAGTEVTTDIVLFQKLLPGEKAEDQYNGWLKTGAKYTNERGEEVILNKYFADRPGHMLGIPSMQGTMYGGNREEFTLEPRPGDIGIRDQISNLLNTDLAHIKDIANQNKKDLEDALAMSVEMNKEGIGIGGYWTDGNEIFMREDDDADGNPTYVKLTPRTLWSDNLIPDGKGGYTRTVVTGTGKEKKTRIDTYKNDASVPDKLRLGAEKYDRIKRMLEMRSKAYELIRAERFDLSEMESLRKELNKLYDSFVKEYGYINDPSNISLMAEDAKIEAGLERKYVKAISIVKARTLGVSPQEANADKATLLNERVFYPDKKIIAADNSRDGYEISLSEKGKLDIPYIAELTDKKPEEVTKELAEAGLIFQDPSTGEWIQEDEYLSGNVKKKLKQVQNDPKYKKNVEALEKVIPKDVTAEEVFVDMGATWVPKEVYQDFLKYMGVENARVNIVQDTGRVSVLETGSIVSNELNLQLEGPLNPDTGRPDYTLDQIFNLVANHKAIVAYDREDDGKRSVNRERTKQLIPIGKKISQYFKDWIFTDPFRAGDLVKIYNETQNTHAKREFRGEHLRTSGANPAINLYRTQRNAAWRMIQSQVVMLDHIVGSGKTMTIITGVQERKRLGLTKKPIIIVPNHIIGQWSKDYMNLYPGANILAASEKDFAAVNRRRLLARMATGTYDAIIIGHSALSFIPLEAETRMTFIREEMQLLERALAEAENAKDQRTVRTLTNRIAKKQEKIRKLMSQPKNDVATWESMGIDYIVVDESHEFKNLEYSTFMQTMAGMGTPTGSLKAFDLYSKIRYLRANNGGVAFATGTPISNSLVEMYSLLRYLNYPELQERKLIAFDAWAKNYAGIENRIEYTATGKLKDRLIMASFNNMPELKQLYLEFSDVVSRQDLKRIYAEQMQEWNKAHPEDQRSTDFPEPKVKDGGRQLKLVEPSEAQREYMTYLVARAEVLEENTDPEYKRIDNHLWLMNDARKMALDIRLVDPKADPGEYTKITETADNVERLYKKWDKDKGTQMVFCDLSTPLAQAEKDGTKFIKASLKKLGLEKDKTTTQRLEGLSAQDKWDYVRHQFEVQIERLSTSTDEADMKRREELEEYIENISDEDTAVLTTLDTKFSVYDELKATLIARGIPEKEIQFIHSFNTRDKKEELFSMVNSGKVRVLIGSSKKMGAGTNAQERLVGLWHMDSPWKPSEVEQREGRIIRQGNKLYERDPNGFYVEIGAFSTSNTFDTVMWQILSRKAEMIESLKGEGRSVEEQGSDSASYADFMAESTGSPAFKEKYKLEQEISELESTERRIAAQRVSSQGVVDNEDSTIAKYKAKIADYKDGLERLKKADTFVYEDKKYKDDLQEGMKAAHDEWEAESDIYNEGIKVYDDWRAEAGELIKVVEAAKNAKTKLESDVKEQWETFLKKHPEPKRPKSPVAPAAISRVKKHSATAQLLSKITEYMSDAPENSEVEWSFGDVKIKIEKEKTWMDTGTRAKEFEYTYSVDGNNWDSSHGVNPSHSILFDTLFDKRGLIYKAEGKVSWAEGDLLDATKKIETAKKTLQYVQFKDAALLAKKRERYTAVVQEVNELEAQVSHDRAEKDNKYILSDRDRFPDGMPQPKDNPSGNLPPSFPVDTDPLFSRREYRGNGLPAKEIKAVVANIEKKWKNGPSIKVAQGHGQLPNRLNSIVTRAGGENSILGIFDTTTNEIWLIGNNIRTTQEAEEAIFHEAYGHYGLRGILGKEGRQILNQIYLSKVKEAKALNKNYGYDLSTVDGRQLIAEEVLAKMAERGEKNTFLQKAYAAIRNWLRDMGFTIKMNDADIRALIAKSEKYVTKGKKAQVKTQGFGEIEYPEIKEITVKSLADGGSKQFKATYKDGSYVISGSREGAQKLIDARISGEALFSASKEQGFDEFADYFEARQQEVEPAGREKDIDLKTIFDKPYEELTEKERNFVNNAMTPESLFSRRSKKTETPEFKKWFGNSKVVDENGEPLVVYHGTYSRKDFKEFFSFSHFGTKEAADHKAINFGAARIIPVYLSIQNPLRVSDNNHQGNSEWALHILGSTSKVTDAEYSMAEELYYKDGEKGEKYIIELLKAKGYDGAVYRNVTEDPGNDSYIPFSPTQIKSATGNIGTFDVNNPDIRFSRRDIPEVSSASDTVEQRMKSAKGLPQNSFRERMAQRLEKTVHSFTRHFPLLSPKTDGAVIDILRLAENIPEYSIKTASKEIRDILGGLQPNQKKLFERVIITEDMMKDIENGILSGQLPFGYTDAAQVQQDLDNYNAAAARSPEVTEARARRKTFMDDLRTKLTNAGLLPDSVNADDRYFHHQVLEHMAVKASGDQYTGLSSGDMRLKKKGWQIARKGSYLDYNTSYVESEMEVISQAISQLEKKKTIAALRRAADIISQVKADAAAQGLENWKDAIPEGYTLWQPEKGNHFYKVYSLTENVLDQLLADIDTWNANIPFTELMRSNEVKQALAIGGKKQEWVIPKRLAKTLDNFRAAKEDSAVGKFSTYTLNSWKQWTLLNPFRIIKYNLNNLSGDLDIALAYDPMMMKYFKQATADLYRDMKGKQLSPALKAEMDAALRKAVISSGISIQEIPDVGETGFFKAMIGKDTNIINKYWWKKAKDFTNLRENILRLAAYRYFKDQLAAGKNLYGASKRSEVDTIRNSDDRAAKLARELIGDYGNISEAGQYIRTHMIPFYSWMAINAPRYYRLFQNLKHEGRGTAPLSGAMAWKATKLGLKASILYGLISLWNATFWPEEEEELGKSGRKQLHIILGRREDGSIISLRFQGALSDALSWFGLENAPKDFEEIAAGRKAWSKQFEEAYKAPVNKLVQGARPLEKTLGEIATGKTLYPDVFSPRPIRDKVEHALKAISVDMPYRFAAGKPSRGDEVAGFVLYKTDPGEAAYYDALSAIRDFYKENDVEIADISPTKKSNALYYYKQAKKYGDKAAQEKYMKQYFDAGGKRQDIIKSIKKSDPLSFVQLKYRTQFWQSLDPQEKKTFERARQWWRETYVEQ